MLSIKTHIVAPAVALLVVSLPAHATSQQAGVPTAPAAEEIQVPEGQVSLGTVRLTTAVLADGQRLAPGTYRLRFTGETAKPPVVGQLEKLERWVEFVQGNAVRGRAVASVVPRSAIKEVADGRPPAVGKHRVERLKGDDNYLRIWINKNGDHVLLHLPMATAQ